ncbi:hypothetical protein BGZ61DRAFT_148921 [Ilyonectria robusta]|uniref:uncharacterized protein n=1 Tax=Ilyonectria robusta TaxID=1079257 RepID=UPI001E8EB7A2|nr:uncharacterized protein BGZ61DRAFT_148921 [Ilyonectria robusta]KAH8661256.1 hypothetical protein BGZ61DRAFT_148921 [Ilyonectria robusta]
MGPSLAHVSEYEDLILRRRGEATRHQATTTSSGCKGQGHRGPRNTVRLRHNHSSKRGGPSEVCASGRLSLISRHKAVSDYGQASSLSPVDQKSMRAKHSISRYPLRLPFLANVHVALLVPLAKSNQNQKHFQTHESVPYYPFAIAALKRRRCGSKHFVSKYSSIKNKNKHKSKRRSKCFQK